MLETEEIPEPNGESRNEHSDSESEKRSSTSGGARFSSEYRMQLVTALKRRLNRQASREPSGPSTDRKDDGDSFSSRMAVGNEADRLGSSFRSISSEAIPNHSQLTVNTERSPANRPESNGGPVLDPFAGRSMNMNDPMVSNARNSRIQQTEEAIRQEMYKECTFRPVINKIPRALAKDHSSFYERAMRWQREKEINNKRRLEMHAANSVTDCTFRPQINRHSEKAARELRGQQSKHGAAAGDESTNERLYNINETLRLQRQATAEEMKRLEDEKVNADTTYMVFTSNNPKYSHVGSKVRNSLLDGSLNTSYGARSRSATPTAVRDPECTFTPKVTPTPPLLSNSR